MTPNAPVLKLLDTYQFDKKTIRFALRIMPRRYFREC